MTPAPIYRDALGLAGVLAEELDAGGPMHELRQRVVRASLDLLEHVCLAIADFDRPQQLLQADAEVCVLRTTLLLAHDVGLIDEDVFLGCSDQLDSIGRQIGGWRRRCTDGPAPRDDTTIRHASAATRR